MRAWETRRLGLGESLEHPARFEPERFLTRLDELHNHLLDIDRSNGSDQAP